MYKFLNLILSLPSEVRGFEREEVSDQFTFDQSCWKSRQLLEVKVEQPFERFVITYSSSDTKYSLLYRTFWDYILVLFEVPSLYFEFVPQFILQINGQFSSRVVPAILHYELYTDLHGNEEYPWEIYTLCTGSHQTAPLQ